MGNTIKDLKLGKVMQDHPHIHGEYVKKSFTNDGTWGSPPHTWGIRTPLLLNRNFFRITPTYMGNTQPVPNYEIPTKDHPHIHGEYSLSV